MIPIPHFESAKLLDAGREWLLIAKANCLVEHVHSLGLVKYNHMPQYVLLHSITSKPNYKCAIVPIGENVLVVALCMRSAIDHNKELVAIRYRNHSHQLLRLQTIGVVNWIASLQSPERQAIQSGLDKLKAVDDSAFKRLKIEVGGRLLVSEELTDSNHLFLENKPPSLSQARDGLSAQIERIEGRVAIGWSTEAKKPDGSCTVLLRNREGNLVGIGEANNPRPDLKMMGISNQPCGFRISLSPTLFDGENQQISLYYPEGVIGAQLEHICDTNNSPGQISHLLMDSSKFMSMFDQVWPQSTPEVRLLAEQLRLSLELVNPTEFKSHVSVLAMSNPRLNWLLKIATAEMSLATGQSVVTAVRLLEEAAFCENASVNCINHCKNMLNLQASK